jgi:hypothetical protein
LEAILSETRYALWRQRWRAFVSLLMKWAHALCLPLPDLRDPQDPWDLVVRRERRARRVTMERKVTGVTAVNRVL